MQRGCFLKWCVCRIVDCSSLCKHAVIPSSDLLLPIHNCPPGWCWRTGEHWVGPWRPHRWRHRWTHPWNHTSLLRRPPCNYVETRNHKGPWHGKTQTYERIRQKIGVVSFESSKHKKNRFVFSGLSLVSEFALSMVGFHCGRLCKKHSSTSSTIFSHGPSNSTRVKHSYSSVVPTLSTPSVFSDHQGPGTPRATTDTERKESQRPPWNATSQGEFERAVALKRL